MIYLAAGSFGALGLCNVSQATWTTHYIVSRLKFNKYNGTPDDSPSITVALEVPG